jgi:hypothetical protein
MLVKTLLFNKPNNKSKNIKKNFNNKNISSNNKSSNNKSNIISSSTLLTVNKTRKRYGGCGCGKK